MGEKEFLYNIYLVGGRPFFDLYGWHAQGRTFRLTKGGLTAEVTSNSGET